MVNLGRFEATYPFQLLPPVLDPTRISYDQLKGVNILMTGLCNNIFLKRPPEVKLSLIRLASGFPDIVCFIFHHHICFLSTLLLHRNVYKSAQRDCCWATDKVSVKCFRSRTANLSFRSHPLRHMLYGTNDIRSVKHIRGDLFRIC